MNNIKSDKLLGGWEERFQNEIGFETKTGVDDVVTETKKINGVVLSQDRDMRNVRSQNERRFSEDKNISDILSPFVKLNRNADIKKVHKLIAPDLDLCNTKISVQ